MGRGWVKWLGLGILWMNSHILAAIWPYEHRREPFLCKGQNTTTRSSEASLSLKPEANSNLGLKKYRSEPCSTLRSIRDHEYSGLISTIWSSETANTNFAQPQPQDREDRFGWSLIPGNNYALEGGNIHCCVLFLSSWEPRLSRQLWIS